MIDFSKVTQNGISIKSSGTSGEQKEIFQPPAKLIAASKVAIDCQKLTSKSRILTICKPDHAAGLLSQTLPAYLIGAYYNIVSFNAYRFFKDIKGYTHTMATPLHLKLIMCTKEFKTCDLSGLFILTGADPVEWHVLEAFVQKGAIVCPNWGMTEIGPICINKTFYNIDQVIEAKSQAVEHTTILGDMYYCDYKLVNGELYVKGDICVYDDWYATKDIVSQKNNVLFFHGRKNMEIKLNDSRKGL